MTNVLIGIGSNLEGPKDQVRKAISTLKDVPDTVLLKASSLYSSKPQGPQDQDDYVNAVALVSTNLSPIQLLLALKNIEAQFGRVKKRHWGERIIDLDIVFYGQDEVELLDPDLVIPHREALNRDFVVMPALEIAPDWVLPNGERLESYQTFSNSYLLSTST